MTMCVRPGCKRACMKKSTTRVALSVAMARAMTILMAQIYIAAATVAAVKNHQGKENAYINFGPNNCSDTSVSYGSFTVPVDQDNNRK